VTGGAGFVGSHVIDKLLSLNSQVIVYDNFSTGRKEFLHDSISKVKFIEGDVLNINQLSKSMKDVDFVFHLSANADIKDNLKDPVKCLHQNTIATSNVLEAMRQNNVFHIAFPSTGSVYGEPDLHPTPIDAPFPIQTSMYAASKLACEGLLEAYATGYHFNVFIFRFVSAMGERYSHGCVFDFYQKLLENPKKLEILGDGNQKKSYLYIKDCVEAMFTAISNSKGNINLYNLGHDNYIKVSQIADIVCHELGLKNVEYNYTGGPRGWIGDSPYIHLDISKIKSLGWKPTKSIEEAVKITLSWLQANKWLLNKR